MIYKILFVVFIGLALVVSCKKEPVAEVFELKFEQPSYFPAPVYTFQNNDITMDRFVLGRKLFYDPLLSSDGTISCASCHSQTHGFSDHNTAFSAGVGGALGVRNSPTIINMAWNSSFMWDGGVNHIETFSLAPITNPVEMNETMVNVIAKLNASATYKDLFKKAYGGSEITDQMLFRALGQFMGMLISDDAKYDKYRRGEVALTADESAGLSLFQQKCASCHTEPLFTDKSFRNNGIDESFADLGRALITQNASDEGKFKVPTLRNVEITYPYMHDGRFFTLSQVLDHYRTGIKNSATLDPSLAGGISITDTEKAQIITFLKTLTDYTLMADPLFAEP